MNGDEDVSADYLLPVNVTSRCRRRSARAVVGDYFGPLVVALVCMMMSPVYRGAPCPKRCARLLAGAYHCVVVPFGIVPSTD